MAISVVVLAVVAVVLFAFAAASVKIVRPFQKGIVEQLGRYKATVEPGLKVIIPVIQSLTRVDMREQVIDVPPQEVITKDNVTVTVDAVIYYEPTDAQRLIYNVANFMLAVTKLAQTNLRNVIGDMTLDNALTSRDNVNVALREVLDDATDKWGVKVVRVEIQRIDPPADVMNAMHEQMKAERNRRAVVLEADGTREAAITRAEGEKQSVILASEAVRQQAILEAEGEAEAIRAVADAERYRQLTVAEGEAEAVRSVFGAIHEGDPTPDLLAIKYLEALGTIADGRATKIFLPTDLGATLGSIGAIAELFNGDGTNDGEAMAPMAMPAPTEEPDEAPAGCSSTGQKLVGDLTAPLSGSGYQLVLALIVLHEFPPTQGSEQSLTLVGATSNHLVTHRQPHLPPWSVEVATTTPDGQHSESGLDIELQVLEGRTVYRAATSHRKAHHYLVGLSESDTQYRVEFLSLLDQPDHGPSLVT